MEMLEEGQNQPKISPKRIKLEEIEEKGEVDRLSALPDCLLVEILSRLPLTEDAINTCILSKRWKHVWTLIPTLIFQSYNTYLPFSKYGAHLTFVDKILTQRPQSKLKKLQVETIYDIKFESQVNNWIRYAISCNVEELILKLYCCCGAVCQLDQIFYISSCFTDLTLQGFISSPTGAISWKNLRSLSISKGRFDEDLIENILSGSPVLETLVLNECYGFKRLDITSKSLKNLVLSGYDRYDIDIAAVIEINAPNISSLTIQDELNLWELLLLDVTSLIEAKLDYWNYGKIPRKVQDKMLKGFIVNLCHVKELKIGPGCGKVLSRLEDKGFDLPSNIKFLDGAISQMEQGDSSAGFDSDYQYESDEDSSNIKFLAGAPEFESDSASESESDEDIINWL